jgi:hypothetical protein
MALFRDNPSDAEKERPLTSKESKRYRTYIVLGALGWITVGIVLAAFILDLIPIQGDYQMYAIGYMILGIVFYSILFVTGYTKGRDRRPGIFEMLRVGGRL